MLFRIAIATMGIYLKYSIIYPTHRMTVFSTAVRHECRLPPFLDIEANKLKSYNANKKYLPTHPHTNTHTRTHARTRYPADSIIQCSCFQKSYLTVTEIGTSNSANLCGATQVVRCQR
jgi:hypothetical protein